MSTSKQGKILIPILFIFSICLFLLIFLGAVDIFQKNFEKAEVSIAPTRTAPPNTVGEFSFRPPSSWRLNLDSVSSSYAKFFTLEKGMIEVVVQPNEDNFATLEKWVQAQQSRHPEYVILSSKEIRVAGVRAVREESAYKPTMKRSDIFVSFMHNNQLYSIGVLNLDDFLNPVDEAKVIREFDQFVESFTLR